MESARAWVVTGSRDELERMIEARLEAVDRIDRLRHDHVSPHGAALLGSIERTERAQQRRINDIVTQRGIGRLPAPDVARRFNEVVAPATAELATSLDRYVDYISGSRAAADAAVRLASRRSGILLVATITCRPPCSASCSRSSRSATRKCATAIKHAAQRMERLVAELLDVASIEENRLSIERTVLRVDEIVAAATEVGEAIAADKGIHLSSASADEPVLVHADRDRLLQVFSNLLDNAVKFTPQGGEVRVRAERIGHDVVFSVEDTGPGLPPGDPARLFERHARAARSAGGGTGLGLHIARGIMEAHGGRIWAAPNEAGGATFSFILPVAGFASGRSSRANALST